ncbi:phosphoenolpyruvate carboxylase, partial [Piscinibacter sp.]|uniref:phosphoenolpyruvate carboxylase n=1 Tax=Piscinibacter sp. TaxID=1903157 RepID=UPI00378507E7
MYARLAATATALGLRREHRTAVGEAPPYPDAAAFADDLDVIDTSLRAGGSPLLAEGRLRQLRRAARIFGFHLATVDLRQNADVHEQVVAELLREARVAPDYLALGEPARQALLRAELATPRPLRSPFATLSDLAEGELAILAEAARAHARLGPEAIRQYVISKAESVSDLLEVAVLLKEAGLVVPGERPAARVQV